jgi:hypothetical protein
MSTRLLATIAGTVLRSELGSIGSMSDFPASGSRFGFSGAWLTEVLSWRGRKYQVVCLDRNIFLMLKAPPPLPSPGFILYFLYIVLTGYFGRFVKRKQGGRTETQNVSVPPRRSTRRVHTPPPTHPPLTTLVRRRCAKSHFNPSQAGARFLVLCFRALMVATAQVQLAVNTSPRASHTQHDCLRPSRRASPRCLPSGQTIMAQRLQQQASRLGCQREPLWCPSTTIL